MKTFKTVTEEAYYQEIADHLENRSEDICKLNGCTEDNHQCECYAYFNYDRDSREYSLADICAPDYAQKCYAAYIILPFSGNAHDLHRQLEETLLEEYWTEEA